MSSFLGAEPPWVAAVENLVPAGVAISIVAYLETFQGVLRRPNPLASEDRFYETLEGFPMLPFSKVTARRCAHLRHQLALEGKRVRPRALDLMIAVPALEHGLTLVIRNRADYQDIPGLIIA